MIKTLHKAMWALLALALIFFSLQGVCWGAVFGAPTNAASNVLEDLQRDNGFNIDDYPEKLDDYSLNVIQIAESADNELFVYVYQPSGQGSGIYASSINIAREKDNTINLSFKNYKLEYLNSSGVFYKYRVKGFELEDRDIRYYNISNILRPFQYMYDELPANGNKVSEVKNRVGQLWTAFTINGEVTYEMTGSEVIEITQMYVGYVGINGGVKIGLQYIYGKYTYKNFIAFSTDHDIDRLIQAEVQYSLCDISFGVCANPLCGWHAYGGTFNKEIGEPKEPTTKTLYADSKSENIDYGWGGHKYVWNDIQSTDAFIKDNNNSDYKLTTEGANDIQGTEWVLNFYNAEFSAKGQHAVWDSHVYHNGQTVHDAMILRLMFETDGITYNLGVVSNVQTGDGKRDNYYVKKDFWERLAEILHMPTWGVKLLFAGIIIFAVIIGIVALCIIFPNITTTIAVLASRRREAAPAKAPKAKAPKAKSSKPRTERTGKTRSGSKRK